MTPKEKAVELFDFMYAGGDCPKSWAKANAIKVVDEVLKSKQTAYPYQVVEIGQVFIDYWQEVKQEIEAL